MGYFRDTLYGLGWMGGLRGVTRLVAFARIAILARILAPEEFGLFGIATLVLAFLEIITETGIKVFFIQGEGKVEEYINTAWIVSIARGLVMALAIILIAPLVAKFFDSPESLKILYLSSIVPALRGLINPSIVKFRKDLKFKKEFGFRFTVFSVESLTAIVVAIITASATSLIWGLIAGVFVEVVMSYKLARPWPKFEFDREKLVKVVGRGKWVTLSGIFDYLFKNLDDVAVGRIMDTYSLGVYQMAYKISSLPITEIADTFNKVTFPVYSKMAGDLERLKIAFRKTILTTTAIVVPIGILLFIFPELVVRILLGDQWMGAVPVIRVLAAFGVIRSVTTGYFALFLAIKKQEYITAVTLVSIAVLVVTIIPLVNNYGIVGAGWSALLGSIVALPLVFLYSRKVFKGS